MKQKINEHGFNGFNGWQFDFQSKSVCIRAIRVPIKSVLVFALCFLLLASCKKELDMTVHQQTVLEGTTFNSIKAGRAWTIEVVQDEKCFVELEYSAYLEPNLKCAVADDVLEIGFAVSGNLASGSVNKAIVHIVDFESLDLTEACKVSVNGCFGKSFTALLDKESSCVGGTFLSGGDISLKGASSMKDYSGEGPFEITMDEDSHFVGNLSFPNAESQFSVTANNHSTFVNQADCSVENAEIQVTDNSLINMALTEIKASAKVEIESNSEATIKVKNGANLMGKVVEKSTLYHYGSLVFAPDFVCDTTSFVKRL